MAMFHLISFKKIYWSTPPLFVAFKLICVVYWPTLERRYSPPSGASFNNKIAPSDTTATDAPIGMGTLVPLAVSTDKEKSVEPLPLVVESFTIIDLSAPLGHARRCN